MQHLTLEAVARLVDEAPEPWEALHLRECLACRRELAGMRAQTGELAQFADPEPSPRAWAALEARLAAEGLVRRRTAAPREHAWMRTAAAVALLVAGGAAGVAVLGRGGGGSPVAAVTPPAPEARVAAASAPERPPADVSTDGAQDPAPGGGIARRVATGPGAGERTRRAPGDRPAAADPERDGRRREAAAALVQAERDYLLALAEYAKTATAEDADPVTRLATLEGLVRATRYALERAPADPVINGYHLAAMGQRDAMLRQIARSSEETWY